MPQDIKIGNNKKKPKASQKNSFSFLLKKIVLGIGLFNSLGRKALSFKALKYVVRLLHSVRGLRGLGRKLFIVL